MEHEELVGLSQDKDGVIEFFKGVMAAFEGFQMNIEEMMAEDDRVTARVIATGTHRAEFMGIPATGKQVNIPMADYFRVEDGKVKEHWGVMDSGAMLMQLGVIEMPG